MSNRSIGANAAEAQGELEKAPVQSLARGMRALEMLLTSGRLRTTDVSTALEIDKGAASRILQTLVHSGFARRDSDRQYVPGPKSVAMARARSSTVGLKKRARPLLEQLVAQSGESSHIAILADDQVLYLDRAVPDAMLIVDRPVGTLAPLDRTALGRAFLAFGKLPIDAAYSAGDPALHAALERFRDQGYADDDEQYYKGVRCVAAPVRDAEGNMVAAVSLSGPAARIDLARMAELGRLIREAAAALVLA